MSIFSRWFSSRTPSELDARLVPVLQMMAIDDRVHHLENLTLAAYLQKLGISAEQAQEIHQRAQGKSIPLPTDPEQKLEVLRVAALMMVCDGDIAVDELDFYTSIAARMQVGAAVATAMLVDTIRKASLLNPSYDLETELAAASAVLARRMRAG
jgi:hypothetical protein